MPELDAIDWFTDDSIVDDPTPYYAHLNTKPPVCPYPHHGVIAVRGYDEVAEVYRDHDTFSSAIAVTGPFPPLPFEPEGDDIDAQIAAHRHLFLMNEHMISMDPPDHTDRRSLLSRLLTPKRLKESEDFLWGLADRHLDEFVDREHCELRREYAKPFTLLAIADLLGVPEADHQEFRTQLGAQRPGQFGGPDEGGPLDPLAFLESWFSSYIEDRRREPRDDVLTGLATATYPDGTLPDVIEPVRVATFVFAAGQDTTAALLGSCLRILTERPELQEQLRANRDQIPGFIEEVLRLEGTVKSTFRLARRPTSLGGVEVPPGTVLLLLNAAANRDAGRFDDPEELRVGRANSREQLSFGRGVHSCPGGPLARVEVRVSLERFLDRMANIRLSEAQHGPPGDRRFAYEPTYILRSLKELHLEWDVVD